MLEHRLCFRVSRMAKVLGVSRSGFYYWVQHRHMIGQRQAVRRLLDTQVKGAFAESKERDGSRRIQKPQVSVIM